MTFVTYLTLYVITFNQIETRSGAENNNGNGNVTSSRVADSMVASEIFITSDKY